MKMKSTDWYLGHFEIVKCLVEKAADIKAKDFWGTTALIYSSMHSNWKFDISIFQLKIILFECNSIYRPLENLWISHRLWSKHQCCR